MKCLMIRLFVTLHYSWGMDMDGKDFDRILPLLEIQKQEHGWFLHAVKWENQEIRPPGFTF